MEDAGSSDCRILVHPFCGDRLLLSRSGDRILRLTKQYCYSFNGEHCALALSILSFILIRLGQLRNVLEVGPIVMGLGWCVAAVGIVFNDRVDQSLFFLPYGKAHANRDEGSTRDAAQVKVPLAHDQSSFLITFTLAFDDAGRPQPPQVMVASQPAAATLGYAEHEVIHTSLAGSFLGILDSGELRSYGCFLSRIYEEVLVKLEQHQRYYVETMDCADALKGPKVHRCPKHSDREHGLCTTDEVLCVDVRSKNEYLLLMRIHLAEAVAVKDIQSDWFQEHQELLIATKQNQSLETFRSFVTAILPIAIVWRIQQQNYGIAGLVALLAILNHCLRTHEQTVWLSRAGVLIQVGGMMLNQGLDPGFKDMGILLQMVIRGTICMFVHGPCETLAGVMAVGVTGLCIAHEQSTKALILVIATVVGCRRIMQWQTILSGMRMMEATAETIIMQHNQLLEDTAAKRLAKKLADAEEQTQEKLLNMQMQVLEARLASPNCVQASEQLTRPASCAEAWTQQWLAPSTVSRANGGAVPVKGLCLAVTSEDGQHFRANKLFKGVLGSTMKLKAGSHAFVKVAGEDHIRVNVLTCEFGEACGHPSLACEQPVLYAGEVEFDENQELVRWCNLSGTYRCPDGKAFQAGLPLDKMWAVLLDSEEATESGILKNSGGVTLRRAFDLTEEAFHGTESQWAKYIGVILSDPDALECYKTLETARQQRQAAVKKYGYLTEAEVQVSEQTSGLRSSSLITKPLPPSLVLASHEYKQQFAHST